MIIGFAGRCRSGKSELAKVCVRNGFNLLSFAIPLKTLCADLLGMSIAELNEAKNTSRPIHFTVDDGMCEILSEKTSIDLDETRRLCLGKEITNVRDMLQFIGTDYIRKCNPDWHVNKIAEMMKPSENYVIDDVRFMNEMDLLQRLGGDVWFIIRPKFDEISNHESETSIRWQDCYNKIIINDSSLAMLLFKWEVFLDNYAVLCKKREDYFHDAIMSDDDTDKRQYLEMLLLHESLFTYFEKKPHGEINTMRYTEGQLQVEYKNGFIEYITNYLNMEDYKAWT